MSVPALRSATITAGFLVLAVAMLPDQLAAQGTREDPTDFQAWFATSLTFDLPDRWEAGLKYRVRLIDDASTYRGSYLYADLSRRWTDMLSTMVEYRLALVDRGTYHRYAAGAEARYDLTDALQVRGRVIGQYQRQNFDDGPVGSTDSDFLLRTRLIARYDLSDAFMAYASTEPYFTFEEDEYFIDNVRNTVGLRWEFRPDQQLEISYIYRPDYARSYNRTFHIISVEAGFTVDPF